MSKHSPFLAIALIATTLSSFFFTTHVFAVSPTPTLYTKSAPPLDTDIDGLTDQGETTIFGTDPLSPDTDGDGYLDGAEVLTESDPLDYYSPGVVDDVVANTQAIQQKEVPWMWYSTRAAGIISYLLLFFLTISGISLSTGLLYRVLGQVWGWRIHQWLGVLMILSLVVHIVALAFDKFILFTISELFIPFISHYQPLLVGLGVLSFWFFVILITTSFIIIQSRFKLWRGIHYFSFPMFVAAFFHSVYLGTDSSTLAMQIVYWSTAIIIGLFVFYRILYSRIPTKKEHIYKENFLKS